MTFRPRTYLLPLLALAIAAAPAATWAADEEIVILGRRLDPLAEASVYTHTEFTAAQLRAAPQTNLDDILRALPGFGLFRRSNGLTAHPTAQGVSLRGIGPNGAGRTLVLLDGVPINDPFGGWVYWNRLSPFNLSRAEIIEGSGAGPWGNGAIGGVVSLSSRDDRQTRVGAQTLFGGDGRAGLAGAAQIATPRFVFGVDGSIDHSDGQYLVRADQRGAADMRAKADLKNANAHLDMTLADGWMVRAAGGYYRETRLNGTALTANATTIKDASVGLMRVGAADEWAFESHIYGRWQTFRSRFSSVSTDRATETLALDQYGVPTNSWGGNAVLRLPIGSRLSLSTGVDARHADGATNENVYSSGTVIRSRVAGGTQTLAGLFVEANWRATDTLAINAGMRLDHWRQSDGSRIETNPSGATLLTQNFANRSGTVANGRLGTSWRVSPSVRLRASGYSGFRAPTLNELYRPFRVGNTITEANPLLDPERSLGGEAGLSWEPVAGLKLDASYYYTILRHAVGNVTLATGPRAFPATGLVPATFVPAGGTLLQRRPIDRVASQGVEISASWQAADWLSLTGRYLWSDSRIDRSNDSPDLVGKRLTQAPLHQGTLDARLDLIPDLSLNAQARASGRQYENDQNTIILQGYVTADIGLDWRIANGLSANVGVTNLFDRTIETGRGSDGLVSIAPPRLWTVRLRAEIGG